MERKIALVTGASGGIGQAIGLQLARNGHDVAFHYKTGRQRAEASVRKAEEFGVRAVAVGGDVSRKDEVESLFREVDAALGLLSVLVNNAGIAIPAPKLEDITDELWDQILAVNLKSHFYCTREAVPRMRQAGRGVIVITGSELAFKPKYQTLPYHISASGRISMTQWLAHDLGPEIRVNCVCPGATATGIGDGRFLSPEVQEAIAAETPMDRFGQPEDVANLVAFLVSGEAGFITGQTYLVNGGRICR